MSLHVTAISSPRLMPVSPQQADERRDLATLHRRVIAGAQDRGDVVQRGDRRVARLGLGEVAGAGQWVDIGEPVIDEEAAPRLQRLRRAVGVPLAALPDLGDVAATWRKVGMLVGSPGWACCQRIHWRRSRTYSSTVDRRRTLRPPLHHHTTKAARSASKVSIPSSRKVLLSDAARAWMSLTGATQRSIYQGR